jgi:hypothetical protein
LGPSKKGQNPRGDPNGEFWAQANYFGATIIMIKREQTTIVLPPADAMQLREEVAELFRRALGVLDRELTELSEVGIQYGEDGTPVSALTEWAKTAKIVSDQIRRDNPTEHLVKRADETGGQKKPSDARPKRLASCKLKVTG